MSVSIRSGESLTIPKNKKLTDAEKKEAKKKIDAAKEKDAEIISGVFKNIECPGSSLQFWFKKYDEPPVYYEFLDGQRYDIPRMVAEHINKGTKVKSHEYPQAVWEGKQVPVITPTGKTRDRYLFVEAAGL
jgi:hypothetical protein